MPSEFEYDWEKDKLRRNKSFKDRWQLTGRTDGGRKLKIIFQLKQGNVVRIITGWQI